MSDAQKRLEELVHELAADAAEGYDGPPNEEQVRESAYGMWRMQGRWIIANIVKEEGIGVSGEDVEEMSDPFIEALTTAVLKRFVPAGSHDPIAETWRHAGPPRPTSIHVPPNANSISHYVLSHDAELGELVYAYSPDYHQFGHAWRWNGERWEQFSSQAYRCGDCAQEWQGGFDPARGGVVGWSFDDEQPVGVLVKPEGVTAFVQEDPGYGDGEYTVVKTTGDHPVPSEDSEWDDLHGVFGIDPERRVTVCLTPEGIWELDESNTWSRKATHDIGTVPDDVNGDRNYGSGGAGAVWDAPRKRVVFWIIQYDTGDNHYHFFDWDGSALQKLDNDGLPEKLQEHFGEKGSVVSQHPEHGAVLYAGELGFFRYDGSAWAPIEAGDHAPPRSKGTRLAWDPTSSGWMLGPGQYDAQEKSEEGEQNVFFTQVEGTWRRQGVQSAKSLLDSVKGSGGWPCLAFSDGDLYAVQWRANLRTARWTSGAGWQEVVDEDQGKKQFAAGGKGRRGTLVSGPDGTLHTISTEGGIYRLDGDNWTVVAKSDDAFPERTGFEAAYDPHEDRFVVWGGDVNDRKSNDTFVWKAGAWKKLPPAKRAVDLKWNYDDHNFTAEFDLGYDTVLERVVRYGYTEVAILDGENWLPCEPERFASLVHHRDRWIAHDPGTGETLIVNWVSGLISRFDLGGCDIVGSFSPPSELPPPKPHEGSRFPYEPDIAFDPKTRSLATHNKEDRWGAYSLDLGPHFDLARSIGARTTELPKTSGVAAVHLYRLAGESAETWTAEVEGEELVITTGSLADRLRGDGGETERRPLDGAEAPVALAKLVETMRADQWKTGKQLGSDELVRIGGVPYRELGLGDAQETLPANRFGGTPSGLDEWPTDDDGDPYGFLFQVETPAELHEGGVAVFCRIDGTATEDSACNIAVLLPPGKLQGKPLEAPEGVPVIPPRALTIGDARYQLDRRIVSALSEMDPEIAGAFDALHDELGSVPFDRIGGCPEFIQGGGEGELQNFLAQIDFDGGEFSQQAEKGWPDCGLFGAIYVFADETETLTYWEYT